MKKTMIALVGGQPLPNLLPVRHYKPDHLILVYTQFTRPVYERLMATIQPDTLVEGLETSPYDIVKVSEDIQNCLDKIDSDGNILTFNLTGGTKAMSLAAYQVAQQRNSSILYLESEKKQNRVYHYTWHNQLLQAQTDELIPACLNLSDFLDVYLGPRKWSQHEPNWRDEGTPFQMALAEALHPHMEVLTNVKTMDGQIDLDIVVGKDNQFGIIEAKYGDKGTRLDGIKQLSTATRHLGTFTQQIYAITVNATPSHEAIIAASRIQVFSVSDYTPGATSLSSEGTSNFVAFVRKALIG